MTKHSKIPTEISEAQAQLKKAMDNATLMNQIMAALTMRLIQRGGNLEMLRSVLSGIDGNERLDTMLEAIDAMTVIHVLVHERVQVKTGGGWLQHFDIRDHKIPELVLRSVPDGWNSDYEQRMPLTLAAVGSFGAMSAAAAESLGASLTSDNAPRGYRRAKTAELISLGCFCRSNPKHLGRLAGKMIIGLGARQVAGAGRSSYLAIYFPTEAAKDRDIKPLLLEIVLKDDAVACSAADRLVLYAANERHMPLGGLR